MHNALLENSRLRAQYASQLHVMKRLESLYTHELAYAVLAAAPESRYLSQRMQLIDTNSCPNDDDARVFASLGRAFDAQYAQTPAVLDACGLTHVFSDVQREMQLKRNEHGAFCLESALSKVAPFDVHTIDRVFWHCVSSTALQAHGVYQIEAITSDSILIKSVDSLRLPLAASTLAPPTTMTTLTMWTAMKRFVELERVVAVCETVVALTGSVSMRLREKSWNVLRPSPSHSNTSRPVSLVQTCVCLRPEADRSFAPHELAVGTLPTLVLGSYQRHKELMHQVAENLLAQQFAGIAL